MKARIPHTSKPHDRPIAIAAVSFYAHQPAVFQHPPVSIQQRAVSEKDPSPILLQFRLDDSSNNDAGIPGSDDGNEDAYEEMAKVYWRTAFDIRE